MAETIEYLKGSVERLLLDLEPKTALRNFRRKSYPDFFQRYCEKEKETYRNLEKLFAESEDLPGDMEEIARPLVQRAQDNVGKTRRFARDRELMDLNCVMAFYVLPGILTIRSEHAGEFALALSKQWKTAFPDTNLTPGTYEEINSGFRRKIFGVPVE